MTLEIRNEDIEVKLANGSTAHTVARVYEPTLFSPVVTGLFDTYCVGAILWFDGELVYAKKGDDYYKFSPFIPRDVAKAMAMIVATQETKELKLQSEDDLIPNPGDYQDALHVQTACNLSGVVHSFNRVMKKICNQSNKEQRGTEWKNSHPICRLYAEQIMHLTAETEYSAAYAICVDEAKKLLRETCLA